MQIQNRWSGASPAWLGVLVGVLLMSSCSLTQSNFKLADHSAQRTNIDSLTQTCWEERVDNAGLARILGQEALETSRGIDYSTGIGRVVNAWPPSLTPSGLTGLRIAYSPKPWRYWRPNPSPRSRRNNGNWWDKFTYKWEM